MTYSGSIFPLIDELPLIRTTRLPSGAREINTPGTFASRDFSIASFPARSRSSAVTVVPARGSFLGRGAGSVPSGRAALLEAHPERSPTSKAQERATRGVNDAI